MCSSQLNMNQTSRTDEGNGPTQGPYAPSSDPVAHQDLKVSDGDDAKSLSKGLAREDGWSPEKTASVQVNDDPAAYNNLPATVSPARDGPTNVLRKLFRIIIAVGKFVGPGFLVAVAYIDPGNYSTGISAGAAHRFRLLFVILLSNLFAVLLQCLAVKLGTVTGLNLAEACRVFLPRWVNYLLYFLAEAAIIATDIAEVIGTAIALNLLIPAIPLVAGCAISILDVFFILIFYRPNGAMSSLRVFEIFVMLLVLTVVVCFGIQLSLIKNTSPREVFRGYVPNDVITNSDGLYQACGILGATVMPHSLYLGSGVVQSRLRDYDSKRGLLPAGTTGRTTEDPKTGEKTHYIPSFAAVEYSLKYTYAEVGVTLATFALFVNSSILIVSGASLYQTPGAEDADIFSIHDLLSKSISPFAGVIFALALLFSGVSAGIVCTIAGQMLCEGALRWRTRPWLRRLITRSIAVTPSIIIAGATGRPHLDATLNATQVVLSIVLPFVTAPLIWFTCFNKYMATRPGLARLRVEGNGENAAARPASDQEAAPDTASVVKMANPWYVSVAAAAIWLFIVVLNIANLVLLGAG
ncbi:natural resistance-associated macrophage protein-domain-containing protein [Xylaria intraflava]|nr:natural resistance-associated macrophage protein-domain-containing protein [Xylaria intraflava]